MQSNLSKWEKELVYKDWYIRLGNELELLMSREASSNNHHKLYSLVDRMLEKKLIPLSKRGPDFDKERAEIDTIVIHHSGNYIKNAHTLSAIGFLRQYGYDYLHNYGLGHNIYGKPVWSGHFLRGKQVFYAYHWVVMPNGQPKRLLKDRYISWHAGDWETNKRSIGIALSGDFEAKSPTKKQLVALQQLIERHYPFVKKKSILLHNQIDKNTKCPGRKFLEVWNG